MNPTERILNLATEALDELDSVNCSLSGVIRRAIRIARLRNDYTNLWWLSYEMIFLYDDAALKRVASEVGPHFSQDEFVSTQEKLSKAYTDERQIRVLEGSRLVDKGKIVHYSISEIELYVQTLHDTAEKTVTPQGLNPIDLLFVETGNVLKREARKVVALEIERVLSRVKQRVHDFLSYTEKQLVFGQVNADIFERNRKYVDGKMGQVAPKVLEQFAVAYRRISEGDPESLSHALTSCRRILKSLADNLYPPRNEPVVCSDGKERKLTDDKFVSRLRQYVWERVGGEKAAKLLLSQIEDVGNRLDKINELSSKGVHAAVSHSEVDQCVIQTYLTIGDILRIADEYSGIGAGDDRNRRRP